MTTEVWYPGLADPAARSAGEYQVFFRDGKTQITLRGRALRDGSPLGAKGPYPLVVVSHGYPGIRFLLSPIAGSVDDVSGYAPGVRSLYEASIHSDRYLMTFESNNHNAGAPMPPPQEAW